MISKVKWVVRILSIMVSLTLIYVTYNLYQYPDKSPPTYYPALLSMCIVFVVIATILSAMDFKKREKE
ncbi:hypothetical protein BK784_15120 [Bacillus thuringiensis serovar medellin]|uniref:Uncharacterized protein n=1 Tax=Bacillus thuringiensis subsp. medellin TaxID=79672 RepID=A0A9X6RGB0_BACTV|nr:hypothetical protein BK784_15120 [Bacillus thuringiensis serovar medellin]